MAGFLRGGLWGRWRPGTRKPASTLPPTSPGSRESRGPKQRSQAPDAGDQGLVPGRSYCQRRASFRDAYLMLL